MPGGHGKKMNEQCYSQEVARNFLIWLALFVQKSKIPHSCRTVFLCWEYLALTCPQIPDLVPSDIHLHFLRKLSKEYTLLSIKKWWSSEKFFLMQDIHFCQYRILKVCNHFLTNSSKSQIRAQNLKAKCRHQTKNTDCSISCDLKDSFPYRTKK